MDPEVATVTPDVPQRAANDGDCLIGTNVPVPVKNTFIDFGEGAQVVDPGMLTAPGKFVGRLAGLNYSAGNTAPSTPAGAGRWSDMATPCNATISMVNNTMAPRITRPAEIILGAPAAPPPPMHTPHIPGEAWGGGFREKAAPAPPMSSPHVKPFSLSLCNAIAPPPPAVLNAIPAAAPTQAMVASTACVSLAPAMMPSQPSAPTMAPVMATSMPPVMEAPVMMDAPVMAMSMPPVMEAPVMAPSMPTVMAAPVTAPSMLGQQMDAGNYIEVKSLVQDGAQASLPRFAPPSYAIGGYNLQTPSGGMGPAPPMYAPSCATPAGNTVNRFFATAPSAAPAFAPGCSSSGALSIPPTPCASAWPPTPF